MEHQRREIARRKASRHAKTTTEDSQLPKLPGIAKVVPDEHDKLFQGFLIVITSHSYRVGWAQNPEYELGTGPLWVTFNRKFPSKILVDLRSRLKMDPRDAELLLGVSPEELEVFPESE